MKKLYTKKDIFFYFSLFLAGITIVIITGDRDILATNSPHDEFWYIDTAYHLFRHQSYSQMSLAHLPIYAYFIKICSLLGVPVRLTIEFFWILGSFLLSKTIYKTTNKNIILSLGIYIYLIFHPYVINYFDRALAENLLACLILVEIFLILEIFSNEKIKFYSNVLIVLFSIIFSVAYFTRNEGITLLLPIILFYIFYILFNLKKGIKIIFYSKLNKIVISTILSIIALSLLLSVANYSKWNSYNKEELSSPGYSAAMKSLISIDAGPTPYQVSVTMMMIEKGARESKTLSELRPFLEGDVGKGWARISDDPMHTSGEIGNGWFYWAIRDAASAAGWYLTPELANDRFNQVSLELEAGFNSGVLKRRNNVFSSFIDPDYMKWVDHLIPTFNDLVKLLLLPDVAYLERRVEDASPDQLMKYTQITGRRNQLPSMELKGWVVGDIENSGFFYEKNLRDIVKLDLQERPDVKNAHGFYLRSNFGVLPNKVCFYKIAVDFESCINLDQLKSGAIISFGNGRNIVGIDMLNIYNKPTRFFDKYFKKLCQLYDVANIALIFISVIYFLVALKKCKLNIYIIAFYTIVFVFIFMRLGMLSVLGASSWSAIQARYILPIIPFFAITIFPLGFKLNYKSIIR